jgi:hypothetical protein
MPEGAVAVFPGDQSWTVQMIDAFVAGKPLPPAPMARPGDM